MKSDLHQIALDARLKAYAPYSRFSVGAALLTESGEVFSGCNVENVSFGLTMCAERVAVGKAIAAGQSALKAIAIVSDSEVPVVPCGGCRQVMAEFNPELSIISWTLSGQKAEFTLASLLPLARQGMIEADVPRGT
ncbi:MAG TPA: cytidine deaminase [Chthoniobacterales bacterium]|jgi:cytidine deaminase|nr:cytidine deaminase [Chthoniobacterales bacterium]